MPSSPVDRPDQRGAGAPTRADGLRALARAYEHALLAAGSGDLDGCARLLDASELLLADGAAAEPGADTAELGHLRDEALAAHARLVSVLRGLHGDLGAELAKVRRGRKALAGYGGERKVGDRVRSKA